MRNPCSQVAFFQSGSPANLFAGVEVKATLYTLANSTETLILLSAHPRISANHKFHPPKDRFHPAGILYH
jgi:hypothetical protein